MSFSSSISFMEKKLNVIDKFINNFNIKIIIFSNIKDGIIREWVLFDEVAIWKQILMNK